MSVSRDFYTVLGLATDAAPDDVKRAYRALARQLHPDANPGDPDSAERFRMLHEAYHVLSTPDLRLAYDQALRKLRPQLGAVQASSGPGGDMAERSAPGSPAITRGGPTPRYQQPDGPVLALHCVPGLAALAPSHERRVFYLLSEVSSMMAPAEAPSPLALAVVIDCSSPMRGPRLDAVRHALYGLLARLGPDDRITVIGFDDRAALLADGAPGEVRGALDQSLDGQSWRETADIAAGLSAALARLAARAGRQRISGLLLLTQGRADDAQHCLQLALCAREVGVAITALGMGADWNRELLDRVATISGGASDFIDQPAYLDVIVADWMARLRATTATDLRISFEPAPGVVTVRATSVSPDIAERFTHTIATSGSTPPATAAEVDVGTVADLSGHEGPAIIWQLMVYPEASAPRDGATRLGRLVARYGVPGRADGYQERVEIDVTVPAAAAEMDQLLVPRVRAALELITAYRLQVQADALVAAARPHEAAIRLGTAAERLRGAGQDDLAIATQRVADALANPAGAPQEDVLRIRYRTKNLGFAGRHRDFA